VLVKGNEQGKKPKENAKEKDAELNENNYNG
jgi:hypothetical protein